MSSEVGFNSERAEVSAFSTKLPAMHKRHRSVLNRTQNPFKRNEDDKRLTYASFRRTPDVFKESYGQTMAKRNVWLTSKPESTISACSDVVKSDEDMQSIKHQI